MDEIRVTTAMQNLWAAIHSKSTPEHQDMAEAKQIIERQASILGAGPLRPNQAAQPPQPQSLPLDTAMNRAEGQASDLHIIISELEGRLENLTESEPPATAGSNQTIAGSPNAVGYSYRLLSHSGNLESANKRLRSLIQRLIVGFVLLLTASSASAQSTTGERVAEVARWGVWAIAAAADAAECPHSAHKVRCWATFAARQGVVQGGGLAITTAFPTDRPCSPNCTMGNANRANTVSRHVGGTVATMPSPRDGVGPRLVVSLSASMLVSLFSHDSTAHTLGGIAAGAGLGYAASFIR